MKKVSYINVLKESLQEADTTKTSDILGPMVEPILGYNGKGELRTHKNVSDILNKYYYEADNNEGLVKVSNLDTTTDGEPDQSKINSVKAKAEKIINSTSETDKPTEKVLDEMVTELEDILLDESTTDDTNNNTENLLEDDDVQSNLEALLEIDDIEDAQGNNDNDIEGASEDVVIDKKTKTKLESILLGEADDQDPEEKGDVAVETKDNDDDDGDEELDVDNEISESFYSEIENILNEDSDSINENESMDEIETILNEGIFEEDERIVDNIESILNEQIDPGVESLSSDDNIDVDIDVDNPVRSKITTESIEDSVLEWLIMEIEDNDSSYDDELLESDVDVLDDEFKVSRISSDDLRI